jgi:hypothetical protein
MTLQGEIRGNASGPFLHAAMNPSGIVIARLPPAGASISIDFNRLDVNF